MKVYIPYAYELGYDSKTDKTYNTSFRIPLGVFTSESEAIISGLHGENHLMVAGVAEAETGIDFDDLLTHSIYDNDEKKFPGDIKKTEEFREYLSLVSYDSDFDTEFTIYTDQESEFWILGENVRNIADDENDWVFQARSIWESQREAEEVLIEKHEARRKINSINNFNKKGEIVYDRPSFYLVKFSSGVLGNDETFSIAKAEKMRFDNDRLDELSEKFNF